MKNFHDSTQIKDLLIQFDVLTLVLTLSRINRMLWLYIFIYNLVWTNCAISLGLLFLMLNGLYRYAGKDEIRCGIYAVPHRTPSI